jgi:hypothetical protein
MTRINANLVVFAVGLGLAAGGAYLVYAPAGLMLAGLVLMVIALFGDQKS